MAFDPILVALALLGVVVVAIAVARISRRPQLPDASRDAIEAPTESGAPEALEAPTEADTPRPEAPEPEPKPAPGTEPEPEPPLPPPTPAGPAPMSKGLAKTRKGFMARLNDLLFSGTSLDEELLEELEALLVTSDIGVRTTTRLLDAVRSSKKHDPDEVRALLREEVQKIVALACPPLPTEHQPMVLMVIGVNGVGKTTTIGKLAASYTGEGKKVVLAAGDTFRAAAVEQLQVWGERSGAQVVRGPDKADPSSVVYDAIQQARRHEAHVCICDTAGRLHTKVNLMEELKKLRRSMDKAMAGAPHEVMLVLDATTGQNAITQAKQFKEAVNVHSIALTKLDGTAKGGVVVAICDELQIPVRFVGVGEAVEDLRPFDPDEFVEALFQRNLD